MCVCVCVEPQLQSVQQYIFLNEGLKEDSRRLVVKTFWAKNNNVSLASEHIRRSVVSQTACYCTWNHLAVGRVILADFSFDFYMMSLLYC